MQPINELNLINQGKVRDIYDLGETLLLVATDRISIYDVILPNLIPQKGFVLTQLSKFWFDKLGHVVQNHLITTEIDEMPIEVRPFKEQLQGRSMLVKKAKPLPVECVVRGYLSGSGYKDYKATGSVCGNDLPDGLVDSQKLPKTLFTPATKAELGDHDENISFGRMKEIIGDELAEKVRSISFQIYDAGVEIAQEKGIIIADTKFEFGMYQDELILIDEVLTPDSSRFWPMETYEPGRAQDSFDKQYVRDFYMSIGWNKIDTPPNIPEDVIKKTTEKYLTIKKLLSES